MTRAKCAEKLDELRSWVLTNFRVENIPPQSDEDTAAMLRRNHFLNIVDDAIYDLRHCKVNTEAAKILEGARTKLGLTEPV